MKLFVLKEPPSFDSKVCIALKDDYHYLVRVRRLSVGHVFTAVEPSGKQGRILIQKIEHDRLLGTWEELPSQTFNEARVILFPALLKGNKLDDVLRASTECGIIEWQPWIARFSQVHHENKNTLIRWKNISEQAMMQSGRSSFVTINPPLPLQELSEALNKCKTLVVFHHLPELSESLHSILSTHEDPIGLVFGPEGGIHEEEIHYFQKNRARFSWLGHAILKSETAIISGLASLHTILREFNSWKIQ